MLYKQCAGCGRRVAYPHRYCEPCQKQAEARRRDGKASADHRYNQRRDPHMGAFYRTKAWKLVREKRLQMAGYLCEYCRKSFAEDVHHIVPIDTPEGWRNRHDVEQVRACCVRCHNREHKRFTSR